MMNYGALVSGLRKTFLSGKTLELEWRRNQLKNFKRFLEENTEVFVDALNKDLRKSKFEAVGTEVDVVLNETIGIIREFEGWMKPIKAEKSIATCMDQTLITKEPFGTVLIMGSWNYPFQLSLAPLPGAIAAGNCAVLKPSELSPHTAQVIKELLPKYMDPQCIKVVTGGIPETTELLKERFDYIFYTGSSNVGRIIHKAANKHLTPVTLELGGKSPVFIDENCPNIENAVRRILWGKNLNSGQTCVAPDYILCTEKTAKTIAPIIKDILKSWYGENSQSSPDLCRIVNERHFDRIKGLIESSKGQILLGGNFDKSDLFIEFTVIAGVSGDDPVMNEEIFGPILPIVYVNSPDEAVDFINSREKPLTLYLFSANKKIQKLFIKHTSSGGMTINDAVLQLSVESLPFGGVGESGTGAYHGKASFDTFTHEKSVLIKDLGAISETLGSFRYPPYSDRKLNIMQVLLKSRYIPDLVTVIKYLVTFGLGVGFAFAVQSIPK